MSNFKVCSHPCAVVAVYLVPVPYDRTPRSIEDRLTDEDRARIDAERAYFKEDDDDLDIEWEDEEEQP